VIAARINILVIGFFLAFFFLFPRITFAANITLSESNRTEITEKNQEYQIKVAISINASDGTIYYLRGVFYKEGSNDYCGFTWNGSSWFSGPYSTSENWKNFLKIEIASSSAATILKAKVDPDDNGCKQSGSYRFKVQRFTQSGSGTFDTQNEQSLNINIPLATLIPTNTPHPTSTPKVTNTKTPTPTGKISYTPTLTSRANPTIVFTPTIAKTTKDTEELISEIKNSSLSSEVENDILGTSSNAELAGTDQAKKETKSLFLIIFLLVGGIGCIGYAVFLSYKKIRSSSAGIF
jgi:hypothetical protein